MIKYGLSLCASLAIISSYLLFSWQIFTRRRYPKGPWSLPIVGNLFTIYKLNVAPEKTCQELSSRYDDLCMLWYGSSPAVLINTPLAAHELLHKVGATPTNIAPPT
jgi:hypothetical protein